eukprot:CAMPEP_0202925182 /NCGR_PEP_ID=MMETSP1392-20130828/79360_1 /ASSEMBLY_ACC=CAM_ASM_000868 /TAXON_ID=225041 /ORGANISM="Chlamydomonas chlamydogama, Strain SAG 11-48b" /LENGTH=48 /DNA_ID= /DNA_START= /DNA_END= /DNA_ORIENTATION=
MPPFSLRATKESGYSLKQPAGDQQTTSRAPAAPPPCVLRAPAGSAAPG